MDDKIKKIRVADEFSKYEKYVAERIDSFMSEGRKPYNELFNSLIKFYYFMSFLLDTEKIKSDIKISPLMVLYSKSALSLLGVVSCLQNGLVGEACLSLRAIFETWLNVKVILEDSTHERINLFRDYEYVLKWLNLLDNQKLIEKGLLTSEQLDANIPLYLRDDVEKNFRRIKENYHPKNPYHWAWKIYKSETNGKNPNIKFLSEHFGVFPEYIRVYTSTSVLVHSMPQCKNVMAAGGTFTLSPNFTGLIFSVGLMALEYCSKIAKEIYSLANEGDTEEILQYIEEYLTDFVLDSREKHFSDWAPSKNESDLQR